MPACEAFRECKERNIAMNERPDKKHAFHDPDPETHKTLLRLVSEQFQASDYKLEIAGSKTKDFYAKAMLHTGSGEGRKAYFKVDGRQRIPAIVMLNGHLLAKWEVTV